jgi:small multidrug resistance pump
MLRADAGMPATSFSAVRKWGLLISAIAIEVAATLSLRASQDHAAWLLVVVAGYAGALVLLTMVLRTGMAVGVAYGIWGAAGTALTAVLGAVIFGDPFTMPIIAGIGLIIAGVLLIEFGSRPPRGSESTP